MYISDVVILIILCEKMRFIANEADGSHWRAERLKESLFSGAVGIIR